MKNCFFILFFIHFVLLSNAQKLTNFRFQLSFEKEKLGIIDPWDFRLEIVNTLNSIVHVYPLDITKGRGSNYGYIQLEIKNNSDLTWKSSECILNMHKELGSPLISLNPGQSIGSTFFCPSPAKGLLEIGDVFVRAVYAPFGIGDTTRLFSNEIKIRTITTTHRC